ncbi:MAG: pitrilysin family protein [Acidobacteriota bacterium]
MKRMISELKRALSAAIIVSLSTILLAAQDPKPSSKGLVIKGKAPISKEVLKVKLPRAFETKLGNGMQVIVLEAPKLPTFAMQMIIQSGGLTDPEDLHGAALSTAASLQEGTKTRTSKQIAEQVGSLGASLSAASGLSSLESRVFASGLTDSFDQILALFADVILNPSFPADELKKFKTRALGQLRLQRAQPGFLADEMFAKVMYGSHPAARIALTAADIQRLTPEALQRFHAAHYKPNNAIFAIVGDVKPMEVLAKLEKAFGSWQRGDVPRNSISKVSEPGGAKIFLINRVPSVQANLVVGNLAIERSDPDYFALDVMNQVIGGGVTSRLFMNLREDKGYTYGAYTGLSAPRYRGTFRASTEVRTDATKGSMNELMYEIKRIRDEKVQPEEFDRTKRTLIGAFALQLESPQALLNNIVTQKLYALPADYWDTYTQKLAAITPDDVQRVARKYLDLSRLQIVAVGDASKIAEVLRQFGIVEIYDTEGKPVRSSAEGK